MDPTARVDITTPTEREGAQAAAGRLECVAQRPRVVGADIARVSPAHDRMAGDVHQAGDGRSVERFELKSEHAIIDRTLVGLPHLTHPAVGSEHAAVDADRSGTGRQSHPRRAQRPPRLAGDRGEPRWQSLDPVQFDLRSVPPRVRWQPECV